MKNIAVFVVLAFVIIGCHKEDDKIDPTLLGYVDNTNPYSPRFGEAAMGSDYAMQIYYDLGSNKTVGQNHRTAWDIAFSCDELEHVILNMGKNDIRAANANTDVWEDVSSAEDLEFVWDSSSGHTDSLAIENMENIYVVNPGQSGEGNQEELRKISVQYLDGAYTVRHSLLDNSDEQVLSFEKDETYNYIFLNFEQGIVSIEPPKEDWDLVFSIYLHIFFPDTDPFPYLVNGCLLNPNTVEAYKEFDIAYEDINRESINEELLIVDRNVIGHDWKFYDFELGYLTDENMNYLVKSTEGDLYKLHFTSFYNSQGETGYPQFEYQQIEQ